MEVTLPGQDASVVLRRKRCLKAAFKYPVDRPFSRGVAFSRQVLTWLLLETTTAGWILRSYGTQFAMRCLRAIRHVSVFASHNATGKSASRRGVKYHESPFEQV